MPVSDQVILVAPLGAAAEITGGGLYGAFSGTPLAFSQVTASPMFDLAGSFEGKTIGDVAVGSRAGSLMPGIVVVEFATINGNNLIVNTRSALALIRAGVPQAEWNLVQNQALVSHISARLVNNGLTSQGTSTLRITGLGRSASNLK